VEQQRQLEANADAASRAQEEADAAASGVAAAAQFARMQAKRSRYEDAQKEKMLQNFLFESGFESVNDIRVLSHLSIPCCRCIGFQYPLHAAFESNDASGIKLLLGAGADPTKKDSEGRIPLTLAHELNHRNSHTRCIVALQS